VLDINFFGGKYTPVSHMHQPSLHSSSDARRKKSARCKRVGSNATFKKRIFTTSKWVIRRPRFARFADDPLDWIFRVARPELFGVPAIVYGVSRFECTVSLRRTHCTRQLKRLHAAKDLPSPPSRCKTTDLQRTTA
jgi:hypothetical protein